jgi:hypothetical protein
LPSVSSVNPETDTPSSRTALGIGMSFLKRSTACFYNSSRLAMAPELDRLREMSSKSAYLTFSVTVRPRAGLHAKLLQWERRFRSPLDGGAPNAGSRGVRRARGKSRA